MDYNSNYLSGLRKYSLFVTQGGTPSVAVSSKCFPGPGRDVEASHVTHDDVFITQFGSASSTKRIIELAVKDILGQAIMPHTMDVAQPTQTSLPHDGDEVV